MYIYCKLSAIICLILNTMCFIRASNRVLNSERTVHLVRCNKTLCGAHVVGILDRTIFSPALIAVAGTQLSLFTSQPCVFFGEGGGGGEDLF